MTQLFGIQLDTLTNILLIITLVIVGIVVLLALTNFIFFKIGVRNIPRRRLQMLLIVFALMLSTTLLASVLTTGNIITSAVQSVAVYNLGNVDEIVEPRHGTFFDDYIYYDLVKYQHHNANIAAVGAALVENDLLVADATSRQVRSSVTGLGIIPGSETGFGGMQDTTSQKTLRIAGLPPNTVYLNQTTATLLNARAGDTIYVYAQRWPGKRYVFHIKAIVADGGLAGQKPYILTQASTFRNIEHRRDDLTQIYIANSGGGGLSGLALSDPVSDALQQHIPGFMRVDQVKADGVQASQNAEEIFSRIFNLFCLFALAVGLLLIFLIFVLLAAERRAEMGMARAIGVQRGQLVLMFLFEGAVYDLLASFVGLAAGIGLGALAVNALGPVLQRFNFPLKLTFDLRSLIIAYCLGVIFTFCSVVISSWLVSRMTIVDALRNLPESERSTLSLGEITGRFAQLLRQSRMAFFHKKGQIVRHIVLEHIPDLFIWLIRSLVLLGFLPLLAGYLLLQYGLQNTEIVPFSLGLSLLAVGTGLLLKTLVEQILYRFGINQKRLLSRLLAIVVGLALVAYWALPFDALEGLGLPRFKGGIEVFFIAGSMMILGAVWALLANADLIMAPLLKLCSWLPSVNIITRLASSYPLHHRFRTGLNVIMFSMVIFAMTVMAIITNAMQNNYTNFDVQTGGYDIQATAYFKPIPNIRTQLAKYGINPNQFSAIGERTSTVTGIIQLNAKDPAWHLYPTQVVNGGFLQGYGLRLAARAQGFSSDSAVWKALQTHPNYALIDDDALPYSPDSTPPVYDPTAPNPNTAGAPNSPPGLDPYYTFSMSGIYQGETNFAPTPIWVAGYDRASALKLTIIGVVDNSDSQHFGLFVNQKAYGTVAVAANAPEEQTYYFKVAPGQDKRALSLKLGSAFLDNGLETTVLEDEIWQVRGPRILISDVLLGMVGMVLLLGVAALAITGTRAVVERRQQIGMLRALGSSRHIIQSAFLFESFLVGFTGSILGVVLGLILAHNIFAVDFFEQFNTGLAFVIPWNQIGIIVGIAIIASLLAALLPAWQAGRVTPTEALRY
jgi:putative ABC transport system permease protein